MTQHGLVLQPCQRRHMKQRARRTALGQSWGGAAQSGRGVHALLGKAGAQGVVVKGGDQQAPSTSKHSGVHCNPGAVLRHDPMLSSCPGLRCSYWQAVPTSDQSSHPT